MSGFANQRHAFKKQAHGRKSSDNSGVQTVQRILNVKHGQLCSATQLAKWLKHVVREELGIKCPRNDIKLIVNDDGSIADYKAFILPEPPVPVPPATEVVKSVYDIWQLNYKQAFKESNDYDADKREGATIVWSLVGRDSKERIENFNNHIAVVEDQYNLNDVLSLLQCIHRTHFSDPHVDDSINLSTAKRNFVNLRMDPNESVQAYHTRWNIVLDAYKTLLEEKGHTAAERELIIGDARELSINFTRSLDGSRYGGYVRKFEIGDKVWFADIYEAFLDAQRQKVANPVGTYNTRGIYAAQVNYTAQPNKGGGKKAGGGKAPTQGCTRCGAMGHDVSVCKNTIVNTRSRTRSSSVDSPGKGKPAGGGPANTKYSKSEN